MTKKKNGEEKERMGRPSIYSDSLAKEICVRLMNGESLRKICADENMPNITVIFDWIHDKPDFSKQYARAREVQAELMADEIIEIADDKSKDILITDFGEQENREFVSRSKLKVDTRKWVASKLLPKKYGDKIGVDLSGDVTTKQVFEIGGQKIEF